MILSGKRHLSRDKLHEVAKRLKLSTNDWEFFETLVLKDQCPGGASIYEKRTKEIRARQKITNVVLSDRELLSDNLSIPVLVYLTDFGQKTAEQLAKIFAVKPARMEQILSVLMNKGNVSKKKWQGQVHYRFNNISHSLNQKEYLGKWFEEGQRRMKTDYGKSETFFNSSIISLNKSNMAAFKSELKELLEKYMSFSDGEHLVQASFQVFPITFDLPK